MRPFITRVESNLKSSIKCSFRKPCVALIGPNGSGKTGVLNAITLATEGVVYDAGYRQQIKDPDMVSQLANPTGTFAEVKIEGAQTQACWTWAKGKRPKVQKAACDVIHLWGISEDIAQSSSDALFEFILDRFLDEYMSPQQQREYLSERLSSTQREIVLGLMDVTGNNVASTLERLKNLKKQASDAVRSLKAVVTYGRAAEAPLDSDVAMTAKRLDAMHTLLSTQPNGHCTVCGGEHSQEAAAKRLEKVTAARSKVNFTPAAFNPATLTILEEELQAASSRESRLKACIQVIHTAFNGFFAGVADDLSQKISRITPRNWEAGIMWRDGTPVYGINLGSRISPAASGAEFVFLVANIAVFLADRIPKDTLCTLILPDRSYDAETLEAIAEVMPETGLNVFIQTADNHAIKVFNRPEWDRLILADRL